MKIIPEVEETSIEVAEGVLHITQRRAYQTQEIRIPMPLVEFFLRAIEAEYAEGQLQTATPPEAESETSL